MSDNDICILQYPRGLTADQMQSISKAFMDAITKNSVIFLPKEFDIVILKRKLGQKISKRSRMLRIDFIDEKED